MSDETHYFSASCTWQGDSDGDGSVQTSSPAPISFGVPESLGGAPERTNPEELLLASLSACYSITLAMLIERKRLPAMEFHVVAEGDVTRQPDRTLKFTAIRIMPRIALPEEGESKRDTLTTLAHKAEQYCVISRALKDNVEITVTPQFVSP